jgi:leucyl aminopeptidase
MDIHFITNCEIEPDVDCLIIPAWDDAVVTAINSPLISTEDQTALQLIHESGVLCGKENFYFPTPLSAYRGILIMGLGKKEGDLANKFRQATGKCVQLLKKMKKHHLLLELEHLPELAPQQFVESLILSQYEHDACKSKKSDVIKVDILCIHICETKDLTLKQAKVSLAATMAESANFARDLGNAPGNYLTPTILADKASALAKEFDVECEILDEAAMEKLGMGSLLSVSQGSSEEARLITLKYTHPKATKTVALVGKGLTFDAGGISIKPSRGMEEMKFDMCGAGAVLGAFRTICAAHPAINVVCVVPSSENLINGEATKPGDVVTAYNGKTIEIYNTDAEGRLILADALAYTVETQKPDIMIDVATLTGACIVALGHEMSAVISEDNELVSELTQAGDETYERLWRLPINDDYKALLKGKDADLCNIGPAYAGTVTAACFLSHFVGETRWAHLDIAGTGWGMKGCSYIKENLASGFGSRLLAQWILNISE